MSSIITITQYLMDIYVEHYNWNSPNCYIPQWWDWWSQLQLASSVSPLWYSLCHYMIFTFAILVLNINIFQHLEVHHTFIKYIDNMAFAGNWTLENIMIVYAGLTALSPLGPVKRNIQFLYLSENNISFIPALYFKGFDSLQQLDLHRNSLQIFPDVTSLSFTLVLLDLDYNRIKSIPRKFFMTKFLLYVQSNKIPSFNYDSIAPWPKLSYIDLGMNDTITLPDIQDEYNNCSTVLLIKCFDDIVYEPNELQ